LFAEISEQHRTSLSEPLCGRLNKQLTITMPKMYQVVKTNSQTKSQKKHNVQWWAQTFIFS